MRKVWVIAAREYKAAVKTKSFLIGIILLPIMMGGGFLAMVLFKGEIDLRPKRFAIVDRTPGQQLYPLVAKAAEQHNEKHAAAKPQTKAAIVLESVQVPAEGDVEELRLALSERVRQGELTGFLEIGPKVPQPLEGPLSQASPDEDEPAEPPAGKASLVEPHALRYQTNRPAYQDFAKWAQTFLNGAVHAQRAEKKGMSVTDLTAIVQRVPLLSKGLTTRDPQTGRIQEAIDQSPVVAFLLPGGLVVLMFMMVLLGAAPLLQGVMEEKMQRIAEVLLGSVQPFPLMMGKILGMAGVSLTMTAVYLAATYWAVRSYGYGEYLSLEIILWFLIYQVLALFLFGSIYAAVGAACTDLKEAQTMLMPVSLISMIPLFVWVNIIREPTSTFATGMSLFPPATPMLMVARQAVPPGLPLWQPILGVVLVLLTTLFCIYAAGRVFRMGILLQGKGARFGDLVRWVIRG
jgi:ABC-2 type transport system permease protein